MRRLIPLLLVLLAVPATALGSGRDVIRDCTDDERLSKRYTVQEYRDALNRLDADTDEYTNCREVIRRAQQAVASGRDPFSSRGGAGFSPVPLPGGSGGGGGVGGGFGDGDLGDFGPPVSDQGPLEGASDDERAAVADAQRSGGVEDVRLPGADDIDPAAVGRTPGMASAGDVPSPLLVVLGLLALGAAATLATRVRSLVVARRAG